MSNALALRSYQTEAVDRIIAAMQAGQRRGLVCAPPGAGKTVVFATAIDRIGKRTVILAHREELIGQAVDKLAMVAPHLTAGVVKAGRNELDADVLVCSVPTLAQEHRRAQLPRDIGLVVVDECHHAPASSWRAVLDDLGAGEPGGPFLLGFTASPDRADGLGLDGLFGSEPLYVCKLLDLIQQGFLCELTARRVFYEADFTKLEVRRGDVTAASAEAAFLSGGGPSAVLQAIREEAGDRQHILVFCSGIESAEETARTINDAGIPAAAIHGNHSLDERRRILDDFMDVPIRVLVNCQLLTEGTDLPATDCVVMARPTRSRALYLQMAGRGFRLHPAKCNTLLLDLTANTKRHDLISPASLVGLAPDDVGQGESLSGAVARKQHREAIEMSGNVRIFVQHQELFAKRQSAWVAAPGGRYALSCANGEQIILQPEDERGRHYSILSVAGGTSSTLRSGLTVDYAMGLGEAHARNRGAAALIDRRAAWRNDPPTDAQLWRLRKERIPFPSDLTKGLARDLISQVEAARAVAAMSG